MGLFVLAKITSLASIRALNLIDQMNELKMENLMVNVASVGINMNGMKPKPNCNVMSRRNMGS